MSTPEGAAHATFPCASCGADLEFKPGTTELVCPYCNATTPITSSETVAEIDYHATLASLASSHDAEDRLVVRCESCGASTPLDPNITSQSCPFCGANIVATAQSQRLIKPKALLPFAIPADQARDRFAAWLRSLWFAPSKLRTLASIERADLAAGSSSRSPNATGLVGVYLPYWTFDAHADTDYTGYRGDNYTVTVPYTTTVNGQAVTRMRTETRIRWTFVSGRVADAFDDVLVPASRSLPSTQLARLGTWDLASIVPYDDRFLAGFRAESYSIPLEPAFDLARASMLDSIRASIRRDIGGDHQRISSMNPRFSSITFKHLLLPLWISTYRYNGRLFRFLVNARTGQVAGERPYSPLKISLLVLAILAAVAAIILLANR